MFRFLATLWLYSIRLKIVCASEIAIPQAASSRTLRPLLGHFDP